MPNPFYYPSTYQPMMNAQSMQFAMQPVQQPVLPAQQILRANGKQSIDAIRMAPNSSVYIEDTTDPNILWKCVSDSLGQVTPKKIDIKEHEDAPIIDSSDLLVIVGQINDRVSKLEGLINATTENAQRSTDTTDSTKGIWTENA